MKIRARITGLWVATCLALVGCSEADSAGTPPSTDTAVDEDAGGTDVDAATDAFAEDAAPVADSDSASPDVAGPALAPFVAPISGLEGRTYTAPVPFAEPLSDYIETAEGELCGACSFTHDVFDLALFDGALHIAYGDATVNVGSLVPVSFRALVSPEAPDVEIGPDSGEEQFDRFRVYGDAMYAAGVDATDDAWLGNVYRRRAGEDWEMFRTVTSGVHVHDMARADGGILAVGSGGTPEEWGNGEVYAHLWTADAELDAIGIAAKELNTLGGDARWTRLLPTASGTFLFGYKSSAQGTIDELPHRVYSGGELTELPRGHVLRGAFVLETDWSDPSFGVVRGADVTASPAVARVWRTAGLDAELVDALVGYTVVDATFVAATGEWVVLVIPSDAWGQSWDGQGGQVWITESWVEFTPLLQVDFPVAARAVEATEDGLYFGLADGSVWRSQSEGGLP